MITFLTRHPFGVLLAMTVLHVLLWTLVPSLVNPSLPLDVIEGLNWGRSWQWGYYKHPPLSPWLMDMASAIDRTADWPLYLLSGLSVAAAFWALWLLARDFLPEPWAIMSVLLLPGIYYYNFTSPEFNANLVLLPLWAWTMLLFWRAIRRDNLSHWALAGGLAGLCMLGKYFSIFLFVPMVALLLTSPYRPLWRRPGPYLALLASLLVFAPHLQWMAAADFVTVSYGLNRSNGAELPWWQAHLIAPMKFFATQIMAVLPLALLFLCLGRPRPIFLGKAKGAETAVKEQGLFLLFVGLGPLLAVVGFAACGGFQLRAMWGTPLLLLTGLMVCWWLRPKLSEQGLRRFAAGWIFVFLLAPAAYAAMTYWSPALTGEGKRVHLAGRTLAEMVTAQWHAAFHRPLTIVVGDPWGAGNVAHYSPDQPMILIDGRFKYSPWISPKMIVAEGAVFLWPIRPWQDPEKASNRVPYLKGIRKNRASCLKIQPPIQVPYQTNVPVREHLYGWAILAPKDAC